MAGMNNNKFLDRLLQASLTEYERKILTLVARKTLGYRKSWDAISGSQFEEQTGIDRRHVWRTLKLLTDRRIVLCEPGSRGRGHTSRYAINLDSPWLDKPAPEGE